MTIIGGFLGAGKTTLLNRLLRGNKGVRYTVLVNDFGQLNIDERLIEKHNGDTIALANGCICCNIGDGLMMTFLTMLKSEPLPEHIVIEASGVADPAKIVQIARAAHVLREDATIILVDGEQILTQLEDQYIQSTAVHQIKSADVILLNKTDLIDEAQCIAVLEKLNEISPQTTIIRSMQANVPMDALFGHTNVADVSHTHDHSHDEVFHAMTFEGEVAFDKESLDDALKAMPHSVLRSKGSVQLTDGHFYTLQKVGPRHELIKNEAAAKTQLVFLYCGPINLEQDITDILHKAQTKF
jgi:G3E family GTPase